MVDVRLLADLPDALDSAAANTFLYKTAGGMEFQTLEYSDIVGYPTTGIDSAGIISLIDASYLATRDSSSHLDVTNYFDSGVSANIKADSAGTTLKIGNYSKPISNLYLDSASTITIGSHSFSLANNGEVSFFGGSASSYGISSGSSSAVIIENSNYTSFLLKTDSTQTDDQTDASGNTTVTEYGNVTSTAFTPYNPKGYSLKLDGNDYITPGFNTNFGTGDFTFECWAKTTVGGVIMGQYDNGSQAEAFEINSTNGIIGSHTDSGTEGTYGSQDLRDNKWHHLVWERNNGTYYYYVDGSLQGSASNSENGQQSSGWYIGRFGVANTGYFTGELRDLKFTVGTAVYGGSAPTVPTELTVSGSETFVFATGLAYNKDLSTNGSSRTITEYGDPQYVVGGPYDHVAYSPSSHGGSVYFDGTGDYLTTSSNIHNGIGTGDFTAEAWVYLDEAIGSNRGIFGSGSSDVVDEFTLLLLTNGSLYFDYGGSQDYVQTGAVFTANTWHHIALTRSGTSFNIWLNGTSVASTTLSANIGGSSNFAVGWGRGIVWKGYISDARVVTGTAVYTAAFTPPTEPLTAISGTQLLTCTNKHDIWDAAGGTKVTPVGNADVSTSQTKFAASNIALDGTGDVVDFFAKDNEFVFGTKDFTIEFWMYPSAVGSENIIVDCRGGHTDAGFLIMLNSSVIKNLTSGAVRTTGGTTITSGSWYHVAVVRDSTSLRTYLNGTEESGSASYTSSITNPSGKLRLGAGFNDASYFNGYIEDLRVTNGLARYTANFTPPTAALEA